MNKETSSRVSSIASAVLELLKRNPDDTAVHLSREDAQALAGSCLSQDETPGQTDAEKMDNYFFTRLKDERENLEARLTALNRYITDNPGRPTPRHQKMLEEQARLMSDLLAVLDERIADIEISKRSETAETTNGG